MKEGAFLAHIFHCEWKWNSMLACAYFLILNKERRLKAFLRNPPKLRHKTENTISLVIPPPPELSLSVGFPYVEGVSGVAGWWPLKASSIFFCPANGPDL